MACRHPTGRWCRSSAPPEVTPAWKDPSAPLVDRWTAAFEALGGHVRRTDRDGVAAAVEQALAGRGPVLVDERALGHLRPAPGDSPPGSLPGHLLHRVVGESPPGASHDNSVHDVPLVWPGCGLDAAATATGGVIEATAGIAATGSIVVDTARNGRLVSLLPRVAVFVLRARPSSRWPATCCAVTPSAGRTAPRPTWC